MDSLNLVGDKLGDLKGRLRAHDTLLMAAPLAGLLLGGVRGARLASRQFTVQTLACPPKTNGELTAFMKHRHFFAMQQAVVHGANMAAKFGLIALGLEASRFVAAEAIEAPLMADMIALGACGVVVGVYTAQAPLHRLISASRYSCFGMLVGASLYALEGLERSLEKQFRNSEN